MRAPIYEEKVVDLIIGRASVTDKEVSKEELLKEDELPEGFGEPAEPPSDDFIMRNAMDSQEVAVGWWPGDGRYGRAAFYAYAHPAPDGFGAAAVGPDAARWDEALGEYVLDWDDVRAAPDPHAYALEFARSAFRHACLVCDWDEDLAASAEGKPPPVT